MSTIAADDIRMLHGRVAHAGGRLVDASVLGSPLTVRQGKLVVMVAGDDEAIAGVRPIWKSSARASWRWVKSAKPDYENRLNLNLPAQILALSEGLLLAVKSGIDRSRALEVMLAGAMASPMLHIARRSSKRCRPKPGSTSA